MLHGQLTHKAFHISHDDLGQLSPYQAEINIILSINLEFCEINSYLKQVEVNRIKIIII